MCHAEAEEFARRRHAAVASFHAREFAVRTCQRPRTRAAGVLPRLGYFKIAVIAEGIYARHVQGMTRGTGFDSVGEAVAPLAAAGLRVLSPGL